ncbi:MAG: glycine--tRNA ligase subunit beta [Clostridia bacterium]|jgi:glycyl-tRNA synthetase beta chain|nr:glycine--tRNA ligase subunit beta [Clostridia bacterium]
MRNLLLEIGTEEIPARYIPSSLKQLKELAQEKLEERRLDFASVEVYGTPRRLVLSVQGLKEQQKDLVLEVRGPAVKAAFDQEGNPTKAALGFAKGQGVEPHELTVKSTENGEYVFATKKEIGGNTSAVLPELLPEIILGVHFAKPMRWGNKELRYVRPIRWIVALYGQELIEFAIEDINTAKISRGHRFLGSQNIMVEDANLYHGLMEENFVIVDPQKRKELILAGVKELATSVQGVAEIDPDLLEEVIYLVEYPTPLMGGFDPKYLEIPKEAVITPMKEHQRYFPVLNQEGELLPKFITVRNGNKEHLEIVQAGNEKVLEARLADAKFFYDEDQKIKLEEYVPRLESVVFQESLGTIYEKVERIIQGVNSLTNLLQLEESIAEKAKRAAYLCKADLVTNMVYEFPELQGIMGEKYAKLSGENEVVAKAIFEHYLPRNAEDILPETMEGTMVSIADKMDTIAGCFAVGIEPTGSQDPYGLRRQALGICKIILDKGLNLPLKALIGQALDNYQSKVELDKEKLTQEIYSFFEQRIRNILTENGYRYDVIEAIITAGYDNLQETLLRAEALEEIKKTANFNKLLTAFTRANNLCKKAGKISINNEYIVENVEKNLYEKVVKAQVEVNKAVGEKEFLRALEIIAQLEEAINAFFEGVMVMSEDENIRLNRLALLQQVTGLVEPIADLTKIVQD